ncbi:AMP-binding protein [Actinacidiphila paucisporea]|uniref:Amino acid adenylation domain-containing protein n=1 Tax=Actinacidiphila paucisporea TaxID=310782 RepID=A0A1M7I6N7_9ACTN|nr:AMP-binding protein [Actinacidiphila paucisporea]SHM36476.1 amino acid adenylation domain-containing protein [Actinacidiphila paucisporea]
MSEPQTTAPADRRVVLNSEGQYSIWWTDRELPAGWRAEGTAGSRERCLVRIQELWADLRPVSLRRRAEAEGEGAAQAEGAADRLGAGAASVPGLVGRQARRNPEAVAVEGDGFVLSYGGLDAASNRWARYLRSRGVGRGVLVGVLLGRGAELHAVSLGVWKAGAGCVPLDPDFPAARLRLLLADAGARVLVTEAAYGPDAFEGQLLCVDDPEVCGELAGHPGEPLAGAPDPDDVACVAHVPAAAGRPHAVTVTHRGLAHHVAWAERELARTGSGGTAVFGSAASELTATGLWAPLWSGQRVLLAPQALDPTRLGEWLAAAGPFGFLKLTPGHLDLLIRQLGDEAVAALAGTFVVAGGEPGPAADQLAELLGPRRLFTSYSTAETSYGTFLHPAPPGAEAQIRVLDDTCRRVPAGVVGELYVAGPGVARGYDGRAALTADRFLPDPYGPEGTRMFRTGELARRTAAGEVELLGRTDRQVWVREHRADPAETEEVLHDHPYVAEAVVIAVRAAPGDVRLAAYVVPRTGARGLDAAALAAHCRQRLPAHLVPASLALLDEVPRAADGRLDVAALPSPGWYDPCGPKDAHGRLPFEGRAFAELVAACRVPGASVAVMEGGDLVAVEAAGTDGEGRAVTPRTAFPVGGLSRHVATLGALRLVDEGVMALDAEVARDGDTSATLADLLGHTGVDAGSDRLPALLEDATGEPFRLLMRRLVLGPLGLDDSWFGEQPGAYGRAGTTGAPAARVGHDAAGHRLGAARTAAGPGELWTTAADLAKVALEIRRSALGAPLALLGRETAARMLTPSPDSLYGLGTMVDVLGSDTEFGHEAAPDGYYAATALRVRTGRGLVVLANGRAGERLRKEIGARLRDVRQTMERRWPLSDGKWRGPEDAQGAG